jgi:hypothetical protein
MLSSQTNSFYRAKIRRGERRPQFMIFRPQIMRLAFRTTVSSLRAFSAWQNRIKAQLGRRGLADLENGECF